MANTVPRSVFHIRMEDFELQTERIFDASLRTRPIAIISSHHQNGTIVSLSSEAREEGLCRGMKVSLTRRMNHSALLLPYNHSLYARLNNYLYTTVSTFTPIVEPAGLGKFYTDMTGVNHLYKSPEKAGSVIAQSIQEKSSLSCTIGISSNKLVSHISTTVMPKKIHQIYRGEEEEFLSPLSSFVLPTTFKPSVKKIIRFLYLNQVFHIQQVIDHVETSKVLFGINHRKLAQESRGQDTSVVCPPKQQGHLLEQAVLSIDTNDELLLRGTVKHLAEQIAYQLRQRRQIARKVTVEIHYTDGFRNARSGKFQTNDDFSVYQVCLNLFEQCNHRRNRIRSILIDTTHFIPFNLQLDIFITSNTKNQILSCALDRIRTKYGFSSIQPAIAITQQLQKYKSPL